MINNKKIITKIKTKKFLKKFPILLLLQHNNCNVKDWLILRQKLQEINNMLQPDSFIINKKTTLISNSTSSEIEILSVKNSLLIKLFGATSLINERNSNLFKNSNHFKKPSLKKNILNFLCQGPNILIGCKDQKHLAKIWNFMKSNPKFIFISCIHNNKLLNHLDLEVFFKAENSSTYSHFFENLDKKTEIYNTLQQSLNLYSLVSIQHNFLNVLSLYSFSKKENQSNQFQK